MFSLSWVGLTCLIAFLTPVLSAVTKLVRTNYTSLSHTALTSSLYTIQVPSSGRSFQMSMVLSGMVCTRAITISNLNASRSITMRSVQTSTFRVQSWLTSSPELWIPFDLGRWAASSAPTTSFSARAVQATTGPKDVSI